MGDNGAGKSTLIKCVAGVHKADSGVIRIHGTAASLSSPRSARRAGIEVVYQDLALCNQLTVWQNLYLDRELTKRLGPVRLLDRRAMKQEAQKAIDSLLKAPPPAGKSVRNLSGGQRQAIAMARAAMWTRGVLVLDEPTAALGVRETGEVEDMIRDISARGITVLIVSHDFEQVMRLASEVWAMRGGSVSGFSAIEQTSTQGIIEMITTGRL